MRTDPFAAPAPAQLIAVPDAGEELADVAIYLLSLAEMTGVDLQSPIEVRGADQLGPAVLEFGVYLLDRGQQFFAAAGQGYRPPRTPAGRRSTPGPAPCESAHKAFPRKRRPLTASGSDGTTHKIGTCL